MARTETVHERAGVRPGWRRTLVYVLATVLVFCVAGVVFYGAYLYTPPQEPRDASAHLESLDSRFVDAGGFRVHYVQGGAGEPVLMLPGGGTWIYEYRDVIPPLAREFRVYAMDLPGNGYSAPLGPDPRYDLPAMDRVLLDFLDGQRIEKVTLVGHSWGAGIALYFAQRHPERVEKLVLLDASGIDFRDPLFYEAMKWPVAGELMTSVFVTPGLVRSQLEGSVHRDELVTNDMVEETYIPATFHENRRALYLLERQLDWSLTERALPDMRTPTLMVWGAEDRIESIAAAKRLEERIPQARLVVVEDAGHSVQEDAPATVSRLITDFVTSSVGKTTAAAGEPG